MTEGKLRLDGFEDIRNVSLEGCITSLFQLDASRTLFLQISDNLPDSRYKELGLYVTEYLENISAMSQLFVCVLHDTFHQDSFLADQRNTY